MAVNFRHRKLKCSETLFFGGLFMWILQSYMIQTDFLHFYGYFPCTIVRLTSLGLFAIKILFVDNKYSKSVFFLSMLCLIISVIVQFTSTQTSINTIVNVFIIVMAARNISFGKITDFVFWVSGSFFIITLCFSFLGIIDNSTLIINGTKRYYLGFDYISFAPIYLVNIIFCGFYAYTFRKKKSLPWGLVFLALLIDYFVYLLTATRLAFGIVLIFIVFYIFVEKFHMPIFNEGHIMKIVSSCLFPIVGIITYWLSVSYDATDIRWIALNQLLSNRIMLNNRALTLYGVKWFGQDIKFNTDFSAGIDKYMYIDSGYMNLLLQYGIIAFFVVLVVYSFMLRNSVKIGDNILTIWLICICIYNMINGMFLSPVSNSNLLAIWLFVAEVKKRGVKSENEYRHRRSDSYI